WAITETKRQQKKRAAVLMAEINVDNRYFLNLNSREHLFKLKSMMKKMDEDLREINYGLIGEEEAIKNHIYRCDVLDLIPSEVVKVIQNNFQLEQPKTLNTLEFKRMDIEMHSIQVCVRDHELIEGEKISLHSQQEVKSHVRRKRRQTAQIKY